MLKAEAMVLRPRPRPKFWPQPLWPRGLNISARLLQLYCFFVQLFGLHIGEGCFESDPHPGVAASGPGRHTAV